jgi:hypothetical protein
MIGCVKKLIYPYTIIWHRRYALHGKQPRQCFRARVAPLQNHYAELETLRHSSTAGHEALAKPSRYLASRHLRYQEG